MAIVFGISFAVLGAPSRIGVPKSRCRGRHTICSASEYSPGSGDKTTGKLLRNAFKQPKAGSNLKLLAAGNYLRELGIQNQADVTRVLDICTNPNSLFGTKRGKNPVNPYARQLAVQEMEAVVEFLGTVGFTGEDILQVILDFPQVLCYSVEDRLLPFFDFITSSLNLDQSTVVEMIKDRPGLLGLNSKSLQQLVEYLKENGSTMEEIVHYLKTSL